jgi:hypothetical protein
MNMLTFRNSIRLLLIVILFLGTITITSLGAIMNSASAQANKPTIVSTMDSYTPSAKDIIGSSPLIAIKNEAPPKLIVDPPLPSRCLRDVSSSSIGRRTCACCQYSAKVP